MSQTQRHVQLKMSDFLFCTRKQYAGYFAYPLILCKYLLLNEPCTFDAETHRQVVVTDITNWCSIVNR